MANRVYSETRVGVGESLEITAKSGPKWPNATTRVLATSLPGTRLLFLKQERERRTRRRSVGLWRIFCASSSLRGITDPQLFHPCSSLRADWMYISMSASGSIMIFRQGISRSRASLRLSIFCCGGASSPDDASSASDCLLWVASVTKTEWPSLLSCCTAAAVKTVEYLLSCEVVSGLPSHESGGGSIVGWLCVSIVEWVLVDGTVGSAVLSSAMLVRSMVGGCSPGWSRMLGGVDGAWLVGSKRTGVSCPVIDGSASEWCVDAAGCDVWCWSSGGC